MTTSQPAHHPTLIVTCRALPNHERDLERWLRQLVAAARTAPGCLDADVEPPNPVHPRDWAVLHHFTDPRALAAWLKSADRHRLMNSGAIYLEGPAHEHVTNVALDPPPITAVLSVPVDAQQMDAFKQLHELSVQRMNAMPGFLHAELLEPVPGVQDDTVILLTFDTRQHLDDWLHSDERRQLVEGQSEHLLGPRTLNVVGGFAGWFAPPQSNNVIRWRSAVAVLIAIVPASQIFLVARLALFPGLNVVVATVVGNVFTVVALTWVLMPAVTRRLSDWLAPQRPVPARDDPAVEGDGARSSWRSGAGRDARVADAAHGAPGRRGSPPRSSTPFTYRKEHIDGDAR
jgi:hypothetical protein